jgi:hypothetical protein
MIKPNVAQSISAIACAIIAAALVAPLTLAAPVAKAATATIETGTMLLSVKGDRQALRTQGTACSDLGWPHYEQHCIFDRSRPADEVRTVRVINLR